MTNELDYPSTLASIDQPVAGVPEVLKDVRACTITSYYNGTYAAAPAGTVLVTMAAYTAGSAKKVLTFVKE